jgi:hypothetical protein
MKTLKFIPPKISLAVTLLLMLGTFSFKTQAQTMKGNANRGDTVTYVLYKDTVSFVSQKTVVYTDKHSVDSLADVLAAGGSRGNRIVYEKMGQKPRVIRGREFRTLDRTGFFRITVAYNKETPTADARLLYMISGK